MVASIVARRPVAVKQIDWRTLGDGSPDGVREGFPTWPRSCGAGRRVEKALTEAKNRSLSGASVFPNWPYPKSLALIRGAWPCCKNMDAQRTVAASRGFEEKRLACKKGAC
jgi:hypothetical protein